MLLLHIQKKRSTPVQKIQSSGPPTARPRRETPIPTTFTPPKAVYTRPNMSFSCKTPQPPKCRKSTSSPRGSSKQANVKRMGRDHKINSKYWTCCSIRGIMESPTLHGCVEQPLKLRRLYDVSLPVEFGRRMLAHL